MQVSIIYSNQHICGGALITSKSVVTSARCCDRIFDKKKALVSVGSLQPFSEEAHVRDVVQSRYNNHDICVLILEEQLPNFIFTAKMARNHFQVSQPCAILGWNSHRQLIYQNVTGTPSRETSNMLCAQNQVSQPLS